MNGYFNEGTEFRAIFEEAAIGIAKTSLDGYFLEVNNAFCSMFGYTHVEMIGLSIREISHSQEIESDRKILQELIEGTKTQASVEKRCIHKNGNIVWTNIYVSLVKDVDKNPLYFISANINITEKKLVQQQNEMLKNQFINFLEQTTDFIYFKDINSRILFCSQNMANITGHARWQDMIGKHDFEIFPPDTAKIYYEEEFPVFKGVPLLNKIDPYYDEKGEKRWVLTNKWPLKDKNNDIVGIFGISRDITEQKNAQEQLTHQQSKMASMGEMMSMITHQWRQPISIVSMIANSIMADVELEEQIKPEALLESMSKINLQVQYLSETINDFRNFFKPDNEKQIEDIKEVVAKTIDIIKKSLDENRISVEIQTPHIEAKIFKNELIQVLINIIINAKDAIVASSGKNGTISIKASQIENLIHISIEDNGGGIPEEFLEKIGNPNITTKESSGTGIGLYMSRLILKNHFNGDISWKNTGNGAIFTATFPANLQN
ncbi:MAG: PAS domain S-box protein [Sulfurospirillaceae bacterium]|nr:PAS domain S-box protein [Sulfurospirillaceae bacterium]MDD3463686.1 PAS domain S-box protein [Sulfurospirillaceae bacterium]